MKEADVTGRRNVLKVAGAGLVAAAIPSVAAGARAGEEEALTPEGDAVGNHPKPIYLHGCGWNHDLPGVFGQICLTFAVKAELNGTGVGTFRDDVHPEVNSQFKVDRVTKHGGVYTLEGEITASGDPSLLGQPVKIVSEKTGNGTGSATITVGSEEGLVVIAIIAILIGMLLPAVTHAGSVSE